MTSERCLNDIKILNEVLCSIGDVAAIEPQVLSDNRDYRVRFHSRIDDIFAKVIDSKGDPENPLSCHQMALEREFVGLNLFRSVSELLEIVNIPKPLSFKRVKTSIENEVAEVQVLLIPFHEELTAEDSSTIIPQVFFTSDAESRSDCLNLAKISAYAHYEFVFGPHQRSLWRNNRSEINSGLKDQINHLRRIQSSQHDVENILDFPYLWYDISFEFDILYPQLIGFISRITPLRPYWLSMRSLGNRETHYFENLAETFSEANKRVIVPGDRSPWNEAIQIEEEIPGLSKTWQFDFEKWSEVPIGRYLGQNLAAIMRFEVPQITNVYALAFTVAWATEGLRPASVSQIKGKLTPFVETLICAAHHAAIFRIWDAVCLSKISKDYEAAKRALETARDLLCNPSYFFDCCRLATEDTKCLEVFRELRARSALNAFKEIEGKLPRYLEEHVAESEKIFRR